MNSIPINPIIEKCYKNYNVNIDILKNKIKFPIDKNNIYQTGECIYYIPPNYTPQNYIFAFDLDNTLTYHILDMYPKTGKDIYLLPNRFPVLEYLFLSGYTIAVFTNHASVTIPNIKERIYNFLKMVNLPIYVFAAHGRDKKTGKNIYRKPEIGMWELFLEKSKIKPKKIYFSGDALGRDANADFADSDKVFGERIGATIIDPENLFGVFDIDSIPKRKKEVVIFVGPPGANKSTMYNRKYKDYIYINKDTQKTREMKLYLNALQTGKSIVVDDTNPSAETRKKFIDPAKNKGYKITILHFVIPGHNYNAKREGVKKVKTLAYSMFYNRFNIPTSEEGDIYIVW
jgi:DNA 3'-phosphatase